MNNEINFRRIAHNVFTEQTSEDGGAMISPESYLRKMQIKSGLGKDDFYGCLIPYLRGHGLASFVTHLRTVREGRRVTLLEVLLEFIESELRPPKEKNATIKKNKATVGLFIDKWHPRKDGLCAVSVRITHNRKKKYYATPFNLSPDDFDKVMGANPRGPFKKIRLKLFDYEKKATEIIDKLPVFTFDRFENMYLRNELFSNLTNTIFDFLSKKDNFIKSIIDDIVNGEDPYKIIEELIIYRKANS